MKNKLTKKELIVINAILINVIKSMEFDQYLDNYTDGGRFVQMLTKDQLEDLIMSYKKINNLNNN
jgi:hypothetical protein